MGAAGDTQHAVLLRADELLYAAKRDGRDRVNVERRQGAGAGDA